MGKRRVHWTKKPIDRRVTIQTKPLTGQCPRLIAAGVVERWEDWRIRSKESLRVGLANPEARALTAMSDPVGLNLFERWQRRFVWESDCDDGMPQNFQIAPPASHLKIIKIAIKLER